MGSGTATVPRGSWSMDTSRSRGRYPLGSLWGSVGVSGGQAGACHCPWSHGACACACLYLRAAVPTAACVRSILAAYAELGSTSVAPNLRGKGGHVTREGG